MSRLQKDFWASEHDFRGYAHPIVWFFSTQRVNYIKRFIETSQVRNILDVGAGEGFSSFYLKMICPEVIAVDFSGKMLSNNAVEKKVIADACLLPFRDNSFDMVCAWELFHHLDDPQDAAREIIRVARKYICVFEANRNNPAQFIYALAHREHRGVFKFNRKYLSGLFKNKTKLAKQASTGVIFPNKTPGFIFPFLKRVPFVIPVFGISNFIICEKV